ncbi:unnamed protein product [Hyaloperonospora brassicae]|uniref:RxLR effector protein n=1 Tax=Hyaloperonospora brassicae TaxID=162125 RepID=A0AAV0T8K9_HYABA|nr:unnamed protein product [Hyaloperonospora brassicae]
MRLAYSTAAVLVAVFASSHAMPTGVDANALPESDVSPVARVTDGGAYDADTQRLLRESFDDDDSALDLNPEERIDSTRISEAAAPITEKIASKGWRLNAVDALAEQKAFNQLAFAKFQAKHKILAKPFEWWFGFWKWLVRNPLVGKLLRPLKDHKIDNVQLRDHYKEAMAKYQEILSVRSRLDEWGGKFVVGATKNLNTALDKLSKSERSESIEAGVKTVVKDLDEFKSNLNPYIVEKHAAADGMAAAESAWTKFETWLQDFVKHVDNVKGAFTNVDESKEVAALKTQITGLADHFRGVKKDEFYQIAQLEKPAAAAVPTVKLPDKPLSGSPVESLGTPKDSNPKVE